MALGEGRSGSALAWQGLSVQVVFAERFKTLVGTGPACDRPLAGGFAAPRARACPEPHAPHTGPEAWLRMGTAGENRLDALGRGRPRCGGPPDQPLRGPRGGVSGRPRPVGDPGTVAALVRGALVACDPGPFMEDFHPLGTHARRQLLPHQAVGHGGIVPLAFHMRVTIHADEFPLRIRLRLGRQGGAAPGGQLPHRGWLLSPAVSCRSADSGPPAGP
jgi:hypothetical protein